MENTLNKIKFSSKIGKESKKIMETNFRILAGTSLCAKKHGLLKHVKTDRFTEEEIHNFENCLTKLYGSQNLNF